MHKTNGWLLIEEAPLETVGYVFSPDKSWGDRTDTTGQVFALSDAGGRIVSSSAKGFNFTHWHPLLAPPSRS